MLARVFADPGVYLGMPWEPGVRGRNWRERKFVNRIGPQDALALAFVLTTPPASHDIQLRQCFRSLAAARAAMADQPSNDGLMSNALAIPA